MRRNVIQQALLGPPNIRIGHHMGRSATIKPAAAPSANMMTDEVTARR